MVPINSYMSITPGDARICMNEYTDFFYIPRHQSWLMCRKRLWGGIHPFSFGLALESGNTGRSRSTIHGEGPGATRRRLVPPPYRSPYSFPQNQQRKRSSHRPALQRPNPKTNLLPRTWLPSH